MENKRYAALNANASLQKKVKKLTALVVTLAIVAAGFAACAALLLVQNGKLKQPSVVAVEPLIPGSPITVPPTAAPDPADSGAVVAEFKGGAVTAGEAIEQYEMLTTYYRLMGMNESEYADEAKKEVVDTIIEQRVLEMKAAELGCYTLSDAQKAELEKKARQEYEAEIEYYKAFRYDESKSDEEIREETIAYLNESGISYEDMLAQAEQSAWAENLRNAVTKDLSISDDELKAFYESQVTTDEMTYSASFYEYELDADAGRTIVWHPEGVRRIESILVPFDEQQMSAYFDFQTEMNEGTADHLSEMDALFDALAPKAQAAKQRLEAGERFEDLQAEYGTLNEGGSYVGAQSRLYGDAFRDVALGLARIGDVSDPVNTDLGVCILRYAGDVAPGRVDFDGVKDALRQNYEQEIRSVRYNETVAKWIEEANVVYHLENF